MWTAIKRKLNNSAGKAAVNHGSIWHTLVVSKTSLAVLLIFAIASCKVGKEYQRPELELPKQFNNNGAVTFADTSSIADIEWKVFFTDPTLTDLIQKGLQYNHDLLIAIKRMDIARLRSKQAKSLQYPAVDLAVTGQISRPSDNSLGGISIKSFLGKSYVENYWNWFTFRANRPNCPSCNTHEKIAEPAFSHG